MLVALSGLKGAAVAATNGEVGTTKDFLFDAHTWRVRWMVVDTGHWLPGRKVLIHPLVIAPLELRPPSPNRLPMMSIGPDLVLSVRLTRQQIEGGPDIPEEEPVSPQLELRVYQHYGWDPVWGKSYFGTITARPTDDAKVRPADGADPQLRSAIEVEGYHIHATDGDIGHVEYLLADDANWDIRYLVIATRNWWPGQHVLMAPYAVQSIDWSERRIDLNVTRDQVKSSPAWDAVAVVDRITEQQLHSHYGWPGYGW
jgi:hypothetical protein